MTTEIAHREVTGLTPEQVDLVKRTIAPDATDDELALFIQQCNRTGLDPFSKQIYSIKRKTKDEHGNWVEVRQTQVAIDGARLIAERAGGYRPGRVQWCDTDGKWRDTWLLDVPPAAARAIVYKDGEEVPFVANYQEFVQTTSGGNPNRMWKAMPAHMLAKCAEMHALRKAFPQELSGLHISEEPELPGPKEMTTVVEEELVNKRTAEKINQALDALAMGDVSRDALDDRMVQNYGTAVVEELTAAQAAELLEKLEGGKE